MVRSGKLNMSLDKSRIPKLGDSSRKLIPEKQRRAMTDLFKKRITRSRTDKGETVSGVMKGHEDVLECEIQTLGSSKSAEK